MVVGEGFEPSKPKASDLQSEGFDHSPIPPGIFKVSIDNNKMELQIGLEPTTC